MSKRLDLLTKEFKKTCKNDKEAEALALLAINIGNVFPYERSSELKENFLSQIRPKTYIPIPSNHRFLFFSILVAVVLFGAVLGVAGSNPGEALYPVKVLSNQMYKTFIKPPVGEISKSPKSNIDLNSNSASNNSVKKTKSIPEQTLSPINKTSAAAEKTLGNNNGDDNDISSKSDNGVLQSVKENVEDVAGQATTSTTNVVEHVEDTVDDVLEIIPPHLGL